MILVVVYVIPAVLAIILSIIDIKIHSKGERLTRGNLLAVLLAGLLPVINIVISVAFILFFVLDSKFMNKFREWIEQPAFKKSKGN